MIYAFLLKRFDRGIANVLIVLWYAILLLLVILTFDLQPGRFRYLQW